MSKRYDAAVPREYEDRNGQTKTAWTRVGTAFEKDGRITLILDALPLPGPDGRAKVVMMEPREQTAARNEPAKDYPNYRKGGGYDAASDNPPF
jgi:hypothetical protein